MTDEHTPDSLADELDALLPPGQSNIPSNSDDPLLVAASWVASAPIPQLSSDVMSHIEAQILNAPSPNKILRPRFLSRSLPRLALVASLVLIVIFVGAVPSALASVPGDVLYPVKQTIERAELSFANSPEAQVGVYMTYAERRTNEAAALFQRGEPNIGLLKSAYASMGTAEKIADEAAFDSNQRVDLQRRALQVDSRIAGIIGQIPDDESITLAPELTDIAQTRTSDDFLPEITATQVPSETETISPTATQTQSATETPSPVNEPVIAETELPTATPTLTASTTITPTATATLLPVNLVIEGPVQKIVGNVITIYDIEIELAPDDPLLDVLEPGDVVLVEGNVADNLSDTPVTGINVEPDDDGVAVHEDGQMWRDSGDCSNPPPDWAPANGWRARCQGASQSGNQGNNGNGQGQGNGQGNGNNGGGRGKGNNDDDD